MADRSTERGIPLPRALPGALLGLAVMVALPRSPVNGRRVGYRTAMSYRTRALGLDPAPLLTLVADVLRLYAVALEDQGPPGEITPRG